MPCFVAVDGHAAGGGAPGVQIFIRIYAAAVSGRAVAGDRAAGQLESTIIKGCAAAIASAGGVVGDAAALHGEGHAYYRYAAAISRRRVAADLAAVHGKAAAGMRTHTAAVVA